MGQKFKIMMHTDTNNEKFEDLKKQVRLALYSGLPVGYMTDKEITVANKIFIEKSNKMEKEWGKMNEKEWDCEYDK